MCGRYLFNPLTGELDEYWQIISNVKKKLKEKNANQEIASGEVFPSQNVIILGANNNGGISAGYSKWGFETYKKGNLLINARVESVEQKKTFSEPFRNSRCVFLMNGFYEWNASKEKYLFTNTEGLMYVGGFYRINNRNDENYVESIILTTPANHSVSPIHNRMPLILNKRDVRSWLLDTNFSRKYLTENMDDLNIEKAF